MMKQREAVKLVDKVVKHLHVDDDLGKIVVPSKETIDIGVYEFNSI